MAFMAFRALKAFMAFRAFRAIMASRSTRLFEAIRRLINPGSRASRGDLEVLSDRRGATAAEIGRLGERLAAAHLVKHDLRIVARNRRIAGVEVDIVAADDARNEWVVVEVKTTTTGTPGERRVDRHRLRRLERAASTLGIDRSVRIMIVAVGLLNTPPEIRIFEV